VQSGQCGQPRPEAVTRTTPPTATSAQAASAVPSTRNLNPRLVSPYGCGTILFARWLEKRRARLKPCLEETKVRRFVNHLEAEHELPYTSVTMSATYARCS
jgi:hypothetical protein